MGTECQLPRSEEDRRMIDEAMNEVQDLSPETYREVMPKVEEALAERCTECLKENVERGKEEINERLAQESREPTVLKKLDLKVRPTDEEYQEIYKVGRELGMKPLEIVNTPAITGIREPQRTIEDKEAMKELMQMMDAETMKKHEDLIKERMEGFRHIDMETMKELMKETLAFLLKSKIPCKWWEQPTVNNIVFVDEQEPGSKKNWIAVEKVVLPEELQKIDDETLERSRNLYLFQNKYGRLLPQTEERKDLHWRIAHGICHINDARIRGRFDALVTPHYSEWLKACEAQLKAGPVSEYALEYIPPKELNDPERVQSDREFRAELFAAWVTNSPKLCPEMKEFFDKYFKE